MSNRYLQIGNMIFKKETITRIELGTNNNLLVYCNGSHTNVIFENKEKAEQALNLALRELND